MRQYALLASLIRKVFKVPAQGKLDNTVSAKTPPTKTTPTKLSSALSSGPDSSLFNGSENTITLSNDDPNEEKLNMLLSDGFPTAENSGIFSWSNDQDDRLFMNDVKVDVTLRTQLGQSPALMLLITNPGKNTGSVDKFMRESVQVSLCFEVGLNGRISVVDSSGLNATNGDAGDTEMQGTDDKRSLQDIHKKIARVLETSQDLGILVEWVLRERLGSG